MYRFQNKEYIGSSYFLILEKIGIVFQSFDIPFYANEYARACVHTGSQACLSRGGVSFDSD